MDKIETSSYNWWVVHTKPKAEGRVIRELNNQGFTTYCPMYRKENLRVSRMQIKTTHLFPRYVFVQENEHAKKFIHAIRSTYGVHTLLKINERPTLLSAQDVQNLKLIEAQNINNTESYFKSGDVIKITEGLYKGLEGIIHLNDGLERVVVLLNFLNKKTPLSLNKNQLSKK